MMDYFVNFMAIVSPIIMVGLYLYIHHDNSRREYLTKGLFLIQCIVTNVTRSNGICILRDLDEVRTIFGLYGADKERKIEREISVLLNDYTKNSNYKKEEEIYSKVAELNANIRNSFDILKKLKLNKIRKLKSIFG
ncbi:MAG: hypothetical protein MK008_10350 [Bdellovibrionales bacterium]|nr:hypothetical protein [Bdellovibrionales bacterium]